MATVGLDHRLLGYNYRLSELNCALGLSQMRRLDQILDHRKGRALRYSQELCRIPEVIVPPLEIPEGRVCWFAFVVRLISDFSETDRNFIRDRMIQRRHRVRALLRSHTSATAIRPVRCRSARRFAGYRAGVRAHTGASVLQRINGRANRGGL